MEQDLANAVRAFFERHRTSDLLEAVVDSSVGGPCLNLWAWRLQPGASLQDAMDRVARTGDWGWLADIVEEDGSQVLGRGLAGIYPDWPDALEQGDARLLGLLQSAAAGLAAATAALFHHVDAWPAVDVRSGVAVAAG